MQTSRNNAEFGIGHNPISLGGSDYTSYFTWQPDIEPETPALAEYKKNYFMPDNSTYDQDAITLLLSDIDFINATKAVVPTIYPGEPFGYHTLYQNIRINNTVIARLLIDEIVSPFTDADFGLCTILGNYFQKALQRFVTREFYASHEMDQVLIGLLSHKLLPEDKIQKALQGQRWEMDDIYICMTAKMLVRSGGQNALSSVALNLSNIFGNECYTLKDDHLIMFFNLTKASITVEQLQRRLLPALRDSMLSAAFSSPFRDFKNIYYYYCQCLSIWRIGHQKDPTKWYFLYKDYALDYLLEKSTDKTIPSVHMPPGLQKLMDYDAENQTSYTDLLRIYLECERNIAQTARITYQHRNTVIYRLNKIEEITGTNLNNPRERLMYQLSYYLLERM